MKTSFYGYYAPSSEQYKQLWETGLIVLDTNVLLNLYRLPTAARDEVMGVLELLKNRLWIPHQVALEFQVGRLAVIASERKTIEEALSSTSCLVSEIKKKVDALQLDKRGLGIDSQPLLDQLETANNQLLEAIKKTHVAQLDISASDPVRDRLDILLESRVGAGPTNQADLDTLISEGEDRFKHKIPPGFADADKGKNPNDATYLFDQIKYQRKFGDLILWRQLIQHIKESGTKAVLLITADRKDDWWWKEQGKTIGPHPELIREIKKDGGVDLFWMYSSVQFIEHANQYVSATVSNESVAEVEQVSHADAQLNESHIAHFHPVMGDDFNPSSRSYRFSEKAVERWLVSHEDIFRSNYGGFPDFLTHRGNGLHGYDIKNMPSFIGDRLSENILASGVKDRMSRGYLEMEKGNLKGFTLIIVIAEETYFDVAEDDLEESVIKRHLAIFLRKFPISSIIIGAIIDEEFRALWVQNSTLNHYHRLD